MESRKSFRIRPLEYESKSGAAASELHDDALKNWEKRQENGTKVFGMEAGQQMSLGEIV